MNRHAVISILVYGVLIGGALLLAHACDVEHREDCEGRGGVYHCSTGSSYSTCDCFAKDGRVLIEQGSP